MSTGLSIAHFYGRVAAEAIFSDYLTRTFTVASITIVAYNNLFVYSYGFFKTP